ncbi:MAG TPA: GNAT family N-acetyltransferase [Ktedonobacterales bacterium]
MTTTQPTTGPSPPLDASAYRAHRVQLRDGAALIVRPIQADDGERLRRFHGRLSPISIRLRYFHLVPSLTDEMITSLTRVDGINQMTLVAAIAGNDAPTAPEPEIIGMVNCNRMRPDAAEVAFIVADAWQGRGVAGALLGAAADCARAHGFRHLLAITLHSNTRMLTALRRSGFPCALQERGDEEVDVWLDITEDLTENLRRRLGSDARETMPDLAAGSDPEWDRASP